MTSTVRSLRGSGQPRTGAAGIPDPGSTPNCRLGHTVLGLSLRSRSRRRCHGAAEPSPADADADRGVRRAPIPPGTTAAHHRPRTVPLPRTGGSDSGRFVPSPGYRAGGRIRRIDSLRATASASCTRGGFDLGSGQRRAIALALATEVPQSTMSTRSRTPPTRSTWLEGECPRKERRRQCPRRHGDIADALPWPPTSCGSHVVVTPRIRHTSRRPRFRRTPKCPLVRSRACAVRRIRRARTVADGVTDRLSGYSTPAAPLSVQHGELQGEAIRAAPCPRGPQAFGMPRPRTRTVAATG